ncbi:MAG: hypothetical protein LBG57_08850, partial [Treponema sp.]|nr:hypothetical protein [Treponema sp.]
MPSLSALREFKSSFDNAGNEKNILAERNIPFNDLDLPDVEAAPMETAEIPAAGIDPAVEAALNPGASPPETASKAGDTDGLGPALETPAAPEAEDAGAEFAAGADFDFGDLLGSMPEDLPLPNDDADLDMPSADAPQPETGAPDSGDENLDLGGEDLNL